MHVATFALFVPPLWSNKIVWLCLNCYNDIFSLFKALGQWGRMKKQKAISCIRLLLLTPRPRPPAHFFNHPVSTKSLEFLYRVFVFVLFYALYWAFWLIGFGRNSLKEINNCDFTNTPLTVCNKHIQKLGPPEADRETKWQWPDIMPAVWWNVQHLSFLQNTLLVNSWWKFRKLDKIWVLNIYLKQIQRQVLLLLTIRNNFKWINF